MSCKTCDSCDGITIDIINKCTSLVAKRNSGKSVLLKHLVNSQKDAFRKIFVICPTESINNFYKEIVPTSCIFDEWKEAWTESLITKMSQINAGKAMKDRDQILLILDDVMSDMNTHSPALKKIFTRGRHCGIAIISTCQYLYQLPPICRNNADYCIVGQMNRMSIQLLADEYLSGDLERKEFINLFNRSTRDYHFLVINCNSIKDNDDLNEIYGVIKAPIE